MSAIISIQNLSKSFGTNKVIKDLSFDVSEGEIFAFLGANGSGKTTTLRALLGIYSAEAGTLLINNKKYSQEHASILGYLPEERGLYVTSKVLETLIYFGQIKGMSYADAKSSAKKYLERVGLGDKENLTINKLSSGQQQKIQLGITIINNPKILILDEPTKGLDPINRALLLEILLELNKSGSTIVFSTHQMEEAEKIADRLVMISRGERVLYGSVEEIKRSYGDKNIHINFNGSLDKETNLYTALVENHAAEITPKENISTNQILKYLVEKNVEIIDINVSAPSLNDIFIKVAEQS